MGFNQSDDQDKQKNTESMKWWIEKVIVPIAVALIGVSGLAVAVTIISQPQIIFGDTVIQVDGIDGDEVGTPIVTPVLSSTPISTQIATETISPTYTHTNTPTSTSTFTHTPLPTASPTPTNTFIPLPTDTLPPTLTDTPIPLQDLEGSNFYPLTLTQSINRWSGYLGIPAGEQFFEDIPYEVGNELNTSGCRSEISANQVTVFAGISHPKTLYLLINAGNGFRQYENIRIGQLRFNFESGEFLYDLVLGGNLRDWATTPNSIVVNNITAPQTEVSEVWSGTAYDGRIGRIDRIVIPVPEPYKNQTLVSIDVIDLSGTGTSNEPCLQIQAITVEADNGE